MAGAGLDLGAVQLLHLSRCEPQPYPGGLLDTRCQLDPDSARAGVLALAWFKLVGFHRRGHPFFDANTFCDATGADDLRDNFVAIEHAWDVMAGEEMMGPPKLAAAFEYVYRNEVQCQPPLDFDILRLTHLGTLLAVIQTQIDAYFDFLLQHPLPMKARKRVNFYQRFLSYEKAAAKA